LIAIGELKYIKLGKKFAVTREELDRWIATHQSRNGH
jgi:hypothetical protein